MSTTKNEIVEVTVQEEFSKLRLDKFLSEVSELNLSRSRVQKLILDELILINDKVANKKHKVATGDKIVVSIPPVEKSEIVGEDIPLEIVFEDDYLAVINKPAGMVTHPGAGNYTGTLVNAIIYHFDHLPESSPVDRPGIVHRLDKNTSGLLLVAKTDEILQKLQEAIQKREVKRIYTALVCGHMQEDEGEVDLPIGRSIKDRKKMIVTNYNSREAQTGYKLKERFRSYDLLELQLKTGRTHQIRVHLSHIGHPVFGDPDYGGRAKWHKGMFGPERPLSKKLLEMYDRQALHAARLEFVHPKSGEEMKFETELPDDFKTVLDILREEGS